MLAGKPAAHNLDFLYWLSPQEKIFGNLSRSLILA